jgi:hypothetical protein
VEAASIRRARSLVFQAEDALDLATMALDKTAITDLQRVEISADVTTVKIKAAFLVEKLSGSTGSARSQINPSSTHASDTGEGRPAESPR